MIDEEGRVRIEGIRKESWVGRKGIGKKAGVNDVNA